MLKWRNKHALPGAVLVFPVVQPYPKSEGEFRNVIAGNEWLLFNLQGACRVFHGLGPFRVSVCKVPFKIAEFGHSSIIDTVT